MFVDTHCHLHDPKFKDTDEVVAAYLESGVDFAINMGCCLETSEGGKTLSERFPSVYFAAGFHPSDVDKMDDTAAARIEQLADCEKCVAIGEIGLDYHWQPFDKIRQKDGFARQIETAYKKKLPISIHCRDATKDTLDVLYAERDKLQYGAVMHCFSGSVETAKELIRRGLYISFAGPLTFKNANAAVEVARFAPLDKILTETDSPFLAPHPLRGTRNEPKNVALVAAHLAEIKEMSVEDLAARVKENALTLFYRIKK